MPALKFHLVSNVVTLILHIAHFVLKDIMLILQAPVLSVELAVGHVPQKQDVVYVFLVISFQPLQVFA